MPATTTPSFSQRREIPDAIRAAVSGGRSREAILATDQMVDVYDRHSGRVVAEILQIEGASWRDPAPLLTDHARAMASMIGSVTTIRRETGKLVGTCRFAKGVQAADETYAKVSQGHARAVSVGYTIIKYTEIRGGQTKTVNGKVYTAPQGRSLRVVYEWELREVSVVPVGADDKAGFRSSIDFSSRSNSSMSTISAIPTENLDQMRVVDLAGNVLRSRDLAPPQHPADRLEAAFPTRAAGSHADGVTTLESLVTTWALDGWRQGVDTLDGICRVESASTYLEEQLATVSVHPRMAPIGRGGIAPSANFAVESKGSQLMKFGLQFKLDEQDAVDGARLGVLRVALEESLRAARALVADLGWVTVLNNPACADSVALFHSSRSNTSTDPLSQATLDAAMGVLGGQTGVDENGQPVHYNLAPRFLIVPPNMLQSTRRLVRPTILEGAELIVRSESRLTDTGVLNPVDNATLVTGNNTNWLLAAPGEQKASLVLSLLNGQTEPTVRQFALKGGNWGVGFDISFSCACTAVDGTSLYWSSGTGA